MHELSTHLMIAWTLGTFLFSAGFGWAGIRIGQKQMSESIKDLKRDVSFLRGQLHKDEQEYMRLESCRQEQKDCQANLKYHEDGIVTRLDELKNYMVETDKKRAQMREELGEKLVAISTELEILKREVSRISYGSSHE